jgi:hypothetical protein
MTMSSTPIEIPAVVRGREAERLQVVQHLDGHLFAERQVDVADEVGQAALLQVPVDEGDDVGERPVEEHPADGRVDQGPFDVLDFRVGDVLVVVLRRQIDVLARVAHPDRRVVVTSPPSYARITSSKSAKMRPSPFEFDRDLVR